jgi:hypothetical protein
MSDNPSWYEQLMVTDDATLNHRYYRVRIKLDERRLEDQGCAPKDPSHYNLEDATVVTLDGPPIIYPPFGSCLYCGVKFFTPHSQIKLSEEHIVSAGIGGHSFFRRRVAKNAM